MTTHRLLIIASDPLIRTGLSAMLANAEGVEIAGQGDSADEAETYIELFQPTAVVWDLGWDAEQIAPVEWQEFELPLIVLMPEEGDSQSWLQQGTTAVLTRSSSLQTIAAALDAAAGGLISIDPAFINRRDAFPPASPRLAESLTPRESEILQLIADGLTNKAIAAELGISAHTVKFHITGILSKLDAQSRTEAAIIAGRLGLLAI